MTFRDLENGMAVEFADGRIGMVFKGFMTFDYIMSGTGCLLMLKGTDVNQDEELYELAIIKVRSVQTFCNEKFLDSNTMFSRGLTLWKYKEPTVEMTLEEVCKELGKDIKIVKGN